MVSSDLLSPWPWGTCKKLPSAAWSSLLEKLFSASLVKLVLGGDLAAGSEWTRFILVMIYPTAEYSVESVFPFKPPAEWRCFK